MLAASAERGELAYVEHAGGRAVLARRRAGRASGRSSERRDRRAPFDGAARRRCSRSLEVLFRHAALFPVGTFLFVVSDFLAPVPARTWVRFRQLRWDVTPVIVQDPVWEQSFPDVGGVVLPVADPATGRVEDVFVAPRDARARRAANEARLDGLRAGSAGSASTPCSSTTAGPTRDRGGVPRLGRAAAPPAEGAGVSGLADCGRAPRRCAAAAVVALPARLRPRPRPGADRDAAADAGRRSGSATRFVLRADVRVPERRRRPSCCVDPSPLTIARARHGDAAR